MGLDRGKLARLFEALTAGVGLATNDRGLLSMAADTRRRRERQAMAQLERSQTIEDQDRLARRLFAKEQRAASRATSVREAANTREDEKRTRDFLEDRAQDFADRDEPIPTSILEPLAKFHGVEIGEIDAAFVAGGDLSPSENVEREAAARRTPGGIELDERDITQFEKRARITQRFSTSPSRLTGDERQELARRTRLGVLEANKESGVPSITASKRDITDMAGRLSRLDIQLQRAPERNPALRRRLSALQELTAKAGTTEDIANLQGLAGTLQADIASHGTEAQRRAKATKEIGGTRGSKGLKPSISPRRKREGHTGGPSLFFEK